MALSMPRDGKALKGVGHIPSWLTDDNAKALSSAPCVSEMQLDMACRHCKPTPKPNREKNEALEAEAAALLKKKQAEAQSTEGEQDDAKSSE